MRCVTPTSSPLPGTAAEHRLGGRLALGAAAAVLVSVPFTLLTLLVLSRFEPLEAADRRVANAFNAYVLPRPALERTLEVLALVTHPNTMRAVAAVIAVALWMRGRRRLVAWLVVTMAVGGLLSPVLKAIVARARPTFDDPVTTAGGFSFPSGHALNSMLLAACLIVLAHPPTRRLRRAAVWTTATVLVAVTAVDRIALGVHYVSDVLAGWTVALATVATTTVAFAAWRRGEGLPPTSPDEGLDPESGVDARHPGDRDPHPAGHPWVRVLGRLAANLLLRWALVLAVLVGVGFLVTRAAETVWPFTVEDGVNRHLAAGRTATGNTLTLFMSGLGNTSTIVPLCLVAVVVLRLSLHRWRESLLVGAVTLAQSVVFLLTTMAIDRERPEVPKLDESPPTSSFPSGHTSAAIALYTSLAVVAHRRIRTTWLRRTVLAVLLSLPVLVGIGRLYRGMHHPSDVTASLLNAGLLLLLSDRLLRRTPLPDDGAAPLAGVAGGTTTGAGATTGAGVTAGPDHPSREVHV